MTQRWRLVNGVELYDMDVDPGQQHEVAAQHPEVVAELRAGYEVWWEIVSRQFDGTIPIPVGQEPGVTALLNAHDWRNDPVECAWNQCLVREGMQCNGYWEVDVRASGTYRFELRRWPHVEDRPIVAGIPGELIRYYDLREAYGGGRALPLVEARLEVAGQAWTASIGPEDKHVTFTLDLQAGETQVQTYFSDAEGQEIGAYFCYVERVGT
jgi:hypothetical protein